MSWEGSGAPVWDAEHLRIATAAAGVALWSWNIDTDAIAMDERAYGLWGVSRSEPVTFEILSSRIHPEDRNRVRTAFEATRALPGPYEIDFRILLGNDVRWVSARGQSNDQSLVGRILFGVFLDVTRRKQAEEAQEMLAGEMSHRVKNLFAVASALTAIAARSAATTAEMAQDLTQRLGALGRAQALVRPTSSQVEKGTPFGDLLAALLAPYEDKQAIRDHIHLSIPDVHVGQVATTTLALVVHELATNAIKHGALSRVGGTIDVSCTVQGGEVVVTWKEMGGPVIDAAERPEGFGTKLVTRSVCGQLGGSIAFDWPAEGLVVTLRMDEARMAR